MSNKVSIKRFPDSDVYGKWEQESVKINSVVKRRHDWDVLGFVKVTRLIINLYDETTAHINAF